MAMTIVGLFERVADAQAAHDELIQRGVSHDALDMKAPHTGEDSHSDLSGLRDQLTEAGVLPEHAARFAEGVRQGDTLLIALTDESEITPTLEVLNRHGALRVRDEHQLPTNDAAYSETTYGKTTEEDTDGEVAVF